MTFEKTVLLSVFLHAVILAALSLSLKKAYIVLPPFEVSLVSPAAQGLFVPESAPPAPAAPKAAKETEKTMPPPPVEKAKSSMVVRPDKANRREQEEEKSLVNDALARLRGRQKEKSLVNNALARLQGVANVENRVRKLKGTLEINKNKTARTGNAAPAGAAGGSNTAIGNYANTIATRIRENWFFPDLKTHGIKAVISIHILKDGTIVPMGFEKHSGSALLDESAMRAVQRTGKVPPPPYELEIAVGFTPD